MQNRFIQVTGTLFCATLLAACGGDGDGSPIDSGSGANKFTQSATWTFELPEAGEVICYDFDAQRSVPDCAGKSWDLMIASGGRSATLWTNSGVSGPGKGGAFAGPFEPGWSELATRDDAFIRDAHGVPMPSELAYLQDAAYGVFHGDNLIAAAAYEYDVDGVYDHQLFPNYRVFLITTDADSGDVVGTPEAPVFALQVTGYYGGASGVDAGHPSLRWIDRANPSDVREAAINASDETSWVHFDLASGTVVDEADDWQIAFSRYYIKLNGGDAGSGTVAGFVGKTPAGLYDANGEPHMDQIIRTTPDDTLAALTAADMATPANARAWVVDTNNSFLNAAYQGSYPQPLDFGWYTYYPTAAAAESAGLPATAHLLTANPEGAALLRSGEGDSFARFHVTDISYADPQDSSSTQTWTIEFDVQPKVDPEI